jgi:hypothetical protein
MLPARHGAVPRGFGAWFTRVCARQPAKGPSFAKEAAVPAALPFETAKGPRASEAAARRSRRLHRSAVLFGAVLFGAVLFGVVPSRALLLPWQPLGRLAARLGGSSAHEQAIAPLTPRSGAVAASSPRVAATLGAAAPGGPRLGVPGGVHIASGVRVVGSLPHPQPASSPVPAGADALLRARAMIIANVAASSASGTRPGRGTPAPLAPSNGGGD